MPSFPASAALSPGRAASLLVAFSSLLHLLAAGGVELSGDEAHYALYGYHLALSYFDHPPLVGWLQALALLFSSSEFALRLWPVLLGALASLALFRLTRALYPAASPWTAFVAVALLHSALAFQVLSLAMLPDTPLLPLGLAAALVLWRVFERGAARDWLWLGVLLGLAGLAKYTAVTLALSAVLLLALSGRWALLRAPWPWLAVALAGLLITPVLWWNWQHDWLSFHYQLGHSMPARSWELTRLLLSQAGQLVAYGPALYLLGLAAVIGGLRRWREAPARHVLVLALPPLLLFGWSSGFEPTLPHWTLLGWALLTPLIAHWLLQHWQRRPVRIIAWGGVGYSLLLTLILHSELIVPWLPFAENQYPFADLHGWKQTAQRAEALRLEMAQEPGPEPVVFAGNWSYASHLAWHARPRPVQVADDRYDQNDLWFGTPQAGARGVLVVPWQFRNDAARWQQRFAQCDPAGDVRIVLRGTVATSYGLYRCDGYRG